MKIQALIDAEEALRLARVKLEPKLTEKFKLADRIITLDKQIDKVLNPLYNKLEKAKQLQCRHLSPWIPPEGRRELYHSRYVLGVDGTFTKDWWSSKAWLRNMNHQSSRYSFQDPYFSNWKITLSATSPKTGSVHQIVIPIIGTQGEGKCSAPTEEIFKAADEQLIKLGWILT